MNLIKLAIDASRCRSGGARSHIIGVLNSSNYLLDSFDEIHLFAPQEICSKIKYRKNIRLHRINTNYLILQILWQWLFLKISLKKMKINILFTCDAATFCNFSPQIVLSQDILPYEKSLNTKGTFLEQLRGIAITIVQKKAFDSSIAVIYLSRYAQLLIENFYKKKYKAIVIPHGFDNDFLSAGVRKSSNTVLENFRLIYISNYLPYKNYENLINALNRLDCEKISNVTLTIVGGGHSRQYKSLKKSVMQDPRLKCRVTFMEFAKKNELLNMYKSHDCFIYTSECEAFGVTLLEALATGIPIIASCLSGLDELYQSHAVKIDPRNTEDIASKIKYMINNYHEINSKSHLRIARAEEFSWDKSSHALFKYLLEQVGS